MNQPLKALVEAATQKGLVALNESAEGPLTITLKEATAQSSPTVIRGVFQRAGVKNVNGRVYSESLWNKHVAKDSVLQQRIAEGACWGTVEHPSDSIGKLDEAAIKVTKLWTEKETDAIGGVRVMGEAEILDTDKGRNVQALVRQGVKIGISSRGMGSIDKDGNVDEATFTPLTWDIVASPSTPGANPVLKPVKESAPSAPAPSNTQSPSKGVGMNINDLQTQLSVLKNTTLTESSVGTVQTALNKLLTDAAALSSSDPNSRFAVEQLVSEAKALCNKCASHTDVSEDGEDGDEVIDAEDLLTQLQEAHELLTAAAASLAETANAKQDLETALEEANANMAALEEAFDELTEQHETAQAVIAGLTEAREDESNETVAEAVDVVVTASPALESKRHLLEAARTPEEVRELASAFSGKEKVEESLPKVGVVLDSTKDQNESKAPKPTGDALLDKLVEQSASKNTARVNG